MSQINEGVLGTSGNPITEAHVISLLATKEHFGFDRMRLMINPHNPLKDPAVFAPYEDRFAMAEFEVTKHTGNDGSIIVCDFEQRAQAAGVSNETVEILPAFKATHPDINPVWLMGADVLFEIHTWGGQWNRLFEEHPVIVIERPGDEDAVTHSIAGRAFARQLVRSEDFSFKQGTWTEIAAAKHPGSSTKVREAAALGERPPYICDASYERIRQNGLYGYPAEVVA